METLADALPKEIERCYELLEDYKQIGPVGDFASMMIKDDLIKAQRAILEGDVVAMLRSYNTLKACQ